MNTSTTEQLKPTLAELQAKYEQQSSSTTTTAMNPCADIKMNLTFTKAYLESAHGMDGLNGHASIEPMVRELSQQYYDCMLQHHYKEQLNRGSKE